MSKDQKQALLLGKAIAVDQLVADGGMVKYRACEKVGIEVWQYHRAKKWGDTANASPESPATQEEISQPGAQVKASVPAMPSEEAKEEMR